MKFIKSIIKKIRLNKAYPDVLFRTLKVGLNCQIGFKADLIHNIRGGVPAKLIKYRFNEEEIEFLNNLKWFNLPEPELHNYKYLFNKKEF